MLSVMLDPIDRMSPTRRPAGHAAMRQRWAELGFLHWNLPAATLAGLVPPALTIDTFDGAAWVGLVPITMTGVRKSCHEGPFVGLVVDDDLSRSRLHACPSNVVVFSRGP